MAFRIFPVALGIFIINFDTAVTEKHDDCYKYDAQVPNGKKKIDLYHECGITDAKTMSNPKRVKCVVKANQAVNEDGTINKEAAHTIINKYAYPEYKNQLLEMVDELLKQPPQNFYTRYPKGVGLYKNQILSMEDEPLKLSPQNFYTRYPKGVGLYKNQILSMEDEPLKLSPQSFYTRYPKGVAKICPNDQLYGNPKGTKKNSSHS